MSKKNIEESAQKLIVEYCIITEQVCEEQEYIDYIKHYDLVMKNLEKIKDTPVYEDIKKYCVLLYNCWNHCKYTLKEYRNDCEV